MVRTGRNILMKLNIVSVQKRLEHYQNIDKFPSEPNNIYGVLDPKN